MRRILIAAAALGVLAGAGGEPPRAEAKEANWCGLYCDAMALGCRKTIGWLDMEACDEWHEGCLDGCAAARG